jgi:hypothetical protein
VNLTAFAPPLRPLALLLLHNRARVRNLHKKPPPLPATGVAETATLLAIVAEETDVPLVTVVADTVTPLVIVTAAMKETKSL